MAKSISRIHRVSRPGVTPYIFYPIVIIGAGESGICLGTQLKQKLGFDQFRIFDRRSGLGGTWYSNTYPGIACDVAALMYSFSFAQNPNWTGVLPPGPEILQYLYNVCADFGILDKIQCDTNVKTVKWVEKDEEWEIVLEILAPGIGDLSTAERNNLESEKGSESIVLRTETVRAKIVASASGGLVEPKPNVNVPGIESFKGKIVHTARWDPAVEIKDKDVVVVGTGCSAAQVVPQLIKSNIGPAKHVTQLLRSPPWAVPFLGEEGKAKWASWMKLFSRVPGLQNVLRKVAFSFAEMEWYRLFDNTEAARGRRVDSSKAVLAHMKNTVPEQYHEILTPNYELFCKRRVVDDGWLTSFQDPRVDITSLPLTSMSANSITLGPGRYYPPTSNVNSKVSTEAKTLPCDVLILANGYQTNEWLHPLDVQGRGGRSLHQVWKDRGGAQAYLGVAMDGFPNFFMIFGPNTATGHTSVILASENMTMYSLNFIKKILNQDVTTVEIKESAERAWTKEVQTALRNSVYQSGGCLSWYADRESGWNGTLYPYSQIDFTVRCMFPKWQDWNMKYSTKGLVKLWLARFVKVALLVAAIRSAFLWRKLGTQGIKDRISSFLRLAQEKAINAVLERMQ